MSTQLSIPSGPFTWSQAQDRGITRAAMTSLLDSRQVIRALHGVYQPADLPNTPATRIQAALLVIPPFAVICDRLAAWVYGFDAIAISDFQALPDIQTCVPPDKTRTRRAGCTGTRRDLLPRDIVVIDGARVTSPVRTAMDLASSLGKRDALAILDASMRVKGLTRDDFERELPRYAGRRGVLQLRRLVPLADPRAESPGESWTRMVILDEGFPTPQLQYSIRQGLREIYRLDLGYERERIAIESSGQSFTTSPSSSCSTELAANGWRHTGGPSSSSAGTASPGKRCSTGPVSFIAC